MNKCTTYLIYKKSAEKTKLNQKKPKYLTLSLKQNPFKRLSVSYLLLFNMRDY
jgi:hypothetical protein